jgi:hypothetical protein
VHPGGLKLVEIENIIAKDDEKDSILIQTIIAYIVVCYTERNFGVAFFMLKYGGQKHRIRGGNLYVFFSSLGIGPDNSNC